MIAPDLRGRSNTTGGRALGRALSRRRAQQTGGDSRSLGHCGRSRVHSDEETRNMNRDPTRTGSIQSQQRLISTGSLIDDVVAERPTEASSRKKFPAGETWRRAMMKATPASVTNQSAGPSLDLFTRQNRLRTGHPILIYSSLFIQVAYLAAQFLTSLLCLFLSLSLSLLPPLPPSPVPVSSSHPAYIQ